MIRLIDRQNLMVFQPIKGYFHVEVRKSRSLYVYIYIFCQVISLDFFSHVSIEYE